MQKTGFSPRQVTLKEGWGYWDVTSHPYGGCFRRLSEDTPATLTGIPTKGEVPCTLPNGNKIIIQVRAIQSDQGETAV